MFLKFLLVGVVIIAIVVGSLFIISAPIVKDLSFCYEMASKEYTASKDRLSVIDVVDKEKICFNGKDILLRFQSCNFQLKSKHGKFVPLAEFLAQVVKPNIKLSTNLIEIHNQACLKYPNSIVTEK